MKNIAKARFWAVRQVDSHTVEIVALADRRDDLKGQVARAIVTGKVEAAEVTFLCLLEGVSLCPDGNIYFEMRSSSPRRILARSLFCHTATRKASTTKHQPKGPLRHKRAALSH